ncbi:glutathione S-transferase [Tropicimonas sp.]|uniref:glutathione S-transferase n=1 Tax=Tropicimonas sp. TaxID=2067044 RepID=UPI003A879311
MTCHLVLGDPAYSSWSMRAWLLFDHAGLKPRITWLDFTLGSAESQLSAVPPARLVPCVIGDEGTVIWESLAIAEELAACHPAAGFWPGNVAARATARSLAAEMHAGFPALRNDCPMNLRTAYAGVDVSGPVAADLTRLAEIWRHARRVAGGEGPWLCGHWSIADAFFAPVAARIAGYGLDIPPDARAYVDAHLAHAGFRRWRAMGLVRGTTLERYARPHAVAPWPGPAPRPARAVDAGRPENTRCPFSGGPARWLAELDGRVIGFGNAFCRDKVVADPDAWPEIVQLLNG